MPPLPVASTTAVASRVHLRTRLVFTLSLVLLAPLTACDDAAMTSAEVLAPGPYAVGTTTLTLVDDTRTTPAWGPTPELPQRTLTTKVWYPSTTGGDGAPVASGGPFPLVAYSHGFSSFNMEGQILNEHLASLGYVVFAPGFPLSQLSTPGGPTQIDIAGQPRDIAFVIDSAIAASATPGNLLEGAVDGERIASVGLSMGGLTSLLVGYHATLRDPRVDVVVAMAPLAVILGDTFYDTRVAPLLVMAGDIDAIVPYATNARVALERANTPVNLYTLVNGTHTGFTSVAVNVFEADDNADVPGCQAITMGSSGSIPPFDFVAALGGSAAGIVPGTLDGACQGPFPYAMRPSRQSDIETAAISSFLESYLASDATVRNRYRDYHEHVLSKESDVKLERR